MKEILSLFFCIVFYSIAIVDFVLYGSFWEFIVSTLIMTVLIFSSRNDFKLNDPDIDSETSN